MAAVAVALGIWGAGCAADATVDDESAASEADALKAPKLYGAWVADSGPIALVTFTSNAAKTLGGEKGQTFSATVDNGVRCITTPCPSTDDVAGVYQVKSATRLALLSYDKPSATFARYLGGYHYAVKGDVLTLKKDDGTVTGTFHRAIDLCGGDVCTKDEHCESVVVDCIKAPCPPIPECRPNECPKPGTVNCQPGPGGVPAACAQPYRGWVVEHCKGVSFAF